MSLFQTTMYTSYSQQGGQWEFCMGKEYRYVFAGYSVLTLQTTVLNQMLFKMKQERAILHDTHSEIVWEARFFNFPCSCGKNQAVMDQPAVKLTSCPYLQKMKNQTVNVVKTKVCENGIINSNYL